MHTHTLVHVHFVLRYRNCIVNGTSGCSTVSCVLAMFSFLSLSLEFPVAYGKQEWILSFLRPWSQAGCWALTVPHSVFQTLGSTTAVPVTGPQVSSLQRLAGQGAAVLPQVSTSLSPAPQHHLWVPPSGGAFLPPSPRSIH